MATISTENDKKRVTRVTPTAAAEAPGQRKQWAGLETRHVSSPLVFFFFFFFGFILFYYANEIPSLCPPPAAPRHVTTQEGHQSPLAHP